MWVNDPPLPEPCNISYEEGYGGSGNEYLFRYNNVGCDEGCVVGYTEWQIIDNSDGIIAEFELEEGESFVWDSPEEGKYEIKLQYLPPGYILVTYVTISFFDYKKNRTIDATLDLGESFSTQNRILVNEDTKYENCEEEVVIHISINKDILDYICCPDIERYQKIMLFNKSYIVLEADEEHLLLGTEDDFNYFKTINYEDNSSGSGTFSIGERELKEIDGKYQYLWCKEYSHDYRWVQISTLDEIVNITADDADFEWAYSSLRSISIPRASPIFEKLTG